MCADAHNAIVRSHWGIENSLHWVLDVTRTRIGRETARTMARKTSLCFAGCPSTSPSWEPSKGDARQTQTCRLGHHIPHRPPRNRHPPPYAIALGPVPSLLLPVYRTAASAASGLDCARSDKTSVNDFHARVGRPQKSKSNQLGSCYPITCSASSARSMSAASL